MLDKASLESPASPAIQESIQAMQSPLESSALSALGDYLLRSGGVPIYWSGGVRYSLSLWELEEYLEAHESLGENP